MDAALPPKICDVLKTVVKGNIDDFTVTVHDPNKKGEGYLGQMFFITLQEKTNGSRFMFAVKQAFSENKIRDTFPIRNAFLNEIYFYTKVWPKLAKFQEEEASGKPSFHHIPRCYAVVSDNDQEMLVLENLKFRGFELHDKKKVLSTSMFEYLFDLYGKYHALSFAYKALHPEEFSELCKDVIDVWVTFSTRENFSEATKMCTRQALEVLEPGVDDQIAERYRHYVEDGAKLIANSLEETKYSAILHGDCWSNNMMFKYDETRNLVDMRFLDFQLCAVASPVCDLSYCLYSGGAKETFDQLDRLLQIYHDALSDSLRSFGCDPDALFPLEALKRDWKKHCQLGVIMGPMLWRGKMTYEDAALDLTDLTGSDNAVEEMQKFFDSKFDEKTYKERVRDILLHLHERDLFV
ncbi:hypothetical protein NQ315_009967 [Exocentrus adspersus]|uniref:CHK kinase-like domain-containing protein n=1 Tax=Exocentrus adspersus TaxID=1586481 RepID=A0AAV8WH56_9CUCU|nr:hypothetical protein NQ315_009967 [Exocentrus adspersus]